MFEVFGFFFYLFLIVAFLYGYYKLVKWLTYDFFTETIEKTGDWVKDYVIVYTKKLVGVILLLPFVILLAFAFIAATGKSSGGGGLYRNRSLYGSDDEEYVIQYRRGSTWIDGPGSNDERVAEGMFDQFLDNDPRSSNRCRLVHKVNGRVQSVLSTN